MLRWMLVLAMACGGGKDDAAGDTSGLPTLATGTATGGGGGGPTTAPDCVDDGFDPILPSLEPSELEFEGFPTLYAVPDDPVAVVFVLHGSGGEIGKLTGLHYIRTYNAWTDAGIAWVATESTDRAGGTWDSSTIDPDANDDMPRFARLRDELIGTTALAADTPVFSWGFSNGGAFSEEFALMGQELGWPVRGFLVHNSSANRGAELPAFFTSAENDDITPATRSAFERHRDSGQPAVWHESAEVPWAVEHALLHPAYDLEMAQEVFDELVLNGLIDDDGIRLVPVEDVDPAMRTYQNKSELNGPARVTPLIRVAWATHRPTSEFACEERDFILEHR